MKRKQKKNWKQCHTEVDQEKNSTPLSIMQTLLIVAISQSQETEKSR